MLHWNILQCNCENFETSVNETTKFDVSDPFILLLNDRDVFFFSKLKISDVIQSPYLIANSQVWLVWIEMSSLKITTLRLNGLKYHIDTLKYLLYVEIKWLTSYFCEVILIYSVLK